jgi:hypothetical protein
MAYETGSATGVNDLIGKLKTFLETNGYTINSFTAIKTGYRLHVQKGDLYINLRSAFNETYAAQNQSLAFWGIALNGSTGYDAGAAGGDFAWHNQPGRPGQTGGSSYGLVSVAGGMNAAIPSYYFFLDTDGFCACIEISTGVFRWFYWGKLTLFGNVGGNALDGFFTGGVSGPFNFLNDSLNPFCNVFGDYGPVFFLYFNVPENTQKWFSAANSVGSYGRTTGLLAFTPFSNSLTATSENYAGYLHNLMRSIPGNLGNLSPLLPCYMGVATPTRDTLLGHFDMVRLTRIAGFTTGQEVSLGGKTWKVLPAISRTHADGYAVAVKKVA